MDILLLISLQKEKSHRILDQAEEMVTLRHWDIAANRYYYACYHMVQALFIKYGISTKTHDGCLSELGKHFILTGKLDKKHGKFFGRMVQLRHKADYNSVADVKETEIMEMIPLSKSFIADVEALTDLSTENR